MFYHHPNTCSIPRSIAIPILMSACDDHAAHWYVPEGIALPSLGGNRLVKQ